MSQRYISQLAANMASGKRVTIPAMNGYDFSQLLWWLNFLQGRAI
ncbi:hypothetical protein F0M60_RS26575 [Escherichia coli]|nr:MULTISPECIES: hypothetical protein [Escherichia]ELF04858.1 hypothetical protein A1Y7_04999 [Escherichia coli KTE119]EQV85086.1 hypothetical protein G893_04244 [Escherichia coli KOEGE 71 (186a)]MCV8637463.1 hypothetical protein [Escherichia coli]MCV8766284.1 hypothetical protein [Escherichia coli]MCV8780296.1 hypothetical protein [Escherichia coli]